MSSVNWWTMKSFCGRSKCPTSCASQADVALTSRAPTWPITWPGICPSVTRHSGSSARPTSGSRSHLRRRDGLREEVGAPGLDVEHEQHPVAPGGAQVARDDGVGLARAVQAVGARRRRWRSPRAAPSPAGPAVAGGRSGCACVEQAPRRRGRRADAERAELRGLRRAVVGDDAMLGQDRAPAAGQLGRRRRRRLLRADLGEPARRRRSRRRTHRPPRPRPARARPRPRRPRGGGAGRRRVWDAPPGGRYPTRSGGEHAASHLATPRREPAAHPPSPRRAAIHSLRGAGHDRAAGARAVAVALDLAQDLPVHPGRRADRRAAAEQQRDAREALLVERVRPGDLVAQQRRPRARRGRAEARDGLLARGTSGPPRRPRRCRAGCSCAASPCRARRPPDARAPRRACPARPPSRSPTVPATW